MAGPPEEDGETVWRPPLRGISTPIPLQNERVQILENDSTREKELLRQIADLVKSRNRIRQERITGPARSSERGKGVRTAEQVGRAADATEQRRGPKTTGSDQIPTRASEFPPLPIPYRNQTVSKGPSGKNVNDTEEWTMAGGRKGGKNRDRSSSKQDEGPREKSDTNPQ